MRTFKHFTWDDRLRIETMLNCKKSKSEIAEYLGRPRQSVYREIRRGRYMHKKSDLTYEEKYSPDIAHEKYRESLKAKGPQLKIGKCHKLAEFIEEMILNERYSPYAVLMHIINEKLKFDVTICVTTLYSYIDKGVFKSLSNKDLPEKKEVKRKYNKLRRAKAPKGESIEQRPKEVESREQFGHWEMDTVKGKRDTKETLLVLTERKTRNELTLPMASNETANVVAEIDKLEVKYGDDFKKIFKTMTVDNGSEFADCEGIERSIKGGKRTKVYYCHPYCSCERGSNEVQNKLVRRWIPKGEPIENYTREYIEKMQDWINNYPRKLFKGRSSAELVKQELVSMH